MNAAKLINKKCSRDELESVITFLNANKPARFNDEKKKELAWLIFNLKNGAVQFPVGNGHTIRARLRDKIRSEGLISWKSGHCVSGHSMPSIASPTPLFINVTNRACKIKHGDSNKPYWEDCETLEELVAFNSFIRGFRFENSLGIFDPIQRFNYCKHEGQVIRQRLGSSVHAMKRTVRPTIKIDGVPVKRLDVKATHPQLLLHKYKNKEMLFDPYDIEEAHIDGNALRDIAKTTFMMMLNTGDRTAARSALDKALRKSENEALRKVADKYSKSLFEIIDQLNKRNPLLAEFFYTKRYVDLQHMESNIAWHCMRGLAAIGIPSLTVHDEVIVKECDIEVARKMYADSWKRETARPFDPIMTTK